LIKDTPDCVYYTTTATKGDIVGCNKCENGVPVYPYPPANPDKVLYWHY